MEVDEKPSETYSDIGGLDKQIEEVCLFYLNYSHPLSLSVSLCLSLCLSLFVSVPLSLTFQLVEAIVLPMTHREKFENIGIQPPKGT